MKSIQQHDPLYKFTEGMVTADRCTIEILDDCPANVAKTIMQAWSAGHIKCSVNFTDQEYTLLGLANEN